ncbi:hypothetical protein EV127DRAFT_449537 [Xylaria flabelliformis]|nr:hypothetical protein EV127DRAFT_449537 [Xylaria flabelliformis]
MYPQVWIVVCMFPPLSLPPASYHARCLSLPLPGLALSRTLSESRLLVTLTKLNKSESCNKTAQLCITSNTNYNHGKNRKVVCRP